MDSIESHKIETLGESKKYHSYVKRALQLLVPVSLLSLLLSYTSGFSFIFSYNFSLHNMSLATFCHVFERKYMFLICNGILAFLAKSLSFGSDNIELAKGINEDGTKRVLLLENVTVEEDRGGVEGEEANGHAEETRAHEACMGRKDGVLLTESEEDGERNDDDDDEVEAEENGMTDEGVRLVGGSSSQSPAEAANEVNINTEELNKKFEEFIRKMKEEIRIEAQQQLIAV